MEKPNKVVDLNTYKKAKVVVKEIDKIIKFYDLALAGLSNYGKYRPVAETIAKLRTDRQQLNIYLKKCQTFLDNKGVK